MKNETMMNEYYPLVSIIVPVFNAEKYISHCLDSILKSSYKHIEVIVIDDGSLDNSAKIIKDFEKKDNRIKALTQDNKGAGQARNKGIDVATGDYIVFVDADDILCNQAVQSCVELSNQTKADIIMFNYETIDSDFDDNDLKGGYDCTTYDLEKWTFSEFWTNYYGNNLVWCVAPWGKFYKKSLFESVRYKSKHYEDEFILQDLIKKDTIIAVSSSVLYLYRIHNESTMATNFSKRYLDKVECFLNRLEWFIEYGCDFVGPASLMLIHSCNILRRYLPIFGINIYKEKIGRAKKLLQRTKSLNFDKQYKKTIKSFVFNPTLYFFFHYSKAEQFLKRLLHLPYKVRYFFLTKKGLKVVSQCLQDGHYKIKDGYIQKISKASSHNFNIFKVKSKNKMSQLFDCGKIMITKYKTILICKELTFYFLKSKERYFESRFRYEHYNNSLPYPTMKLSFDDEKLLIIGETVTGIKFKRNERFNVILDFLFNSYRHSMNNPTQKQVGNQISSVPFCIQHGDLKDSNIIWYNNVDFCLIDLEAIGEKPIFFDLFFYILISKKEKAYVTFKNQYFKEKLMNLASNKGVVNTSVDKLLLAYFIHLMNGLKQEHTKSYYDYYLKNLCILISNNDELIQCRAYLNAIEFGRIRR